MSTISVVRHYGHDGKVYRIRDVFSTGGVFQTCEYATKDEAGLAVWTPCREGVAFADIKPFETKGVPI